MAHPQPMSLQVPLLRSGFFTGTCSLVARPLTHLLHNKLMFGRATHEQVELICYTTTSFTTTTNGQVVQQAVQLVCVI